MLPTVLRAHRAVLDPRDDGNGAINLPKSDR
jgi:hypothetical protein